VANASDPRYRAVHAYLSDEAHAIWQEVATDYGVSVSGLIEAMGADLNKPVGERVLTPQLDGLVTRARRVDAARRRRSRPAVAS
jgi:nicotinamide mononucleotide (NMN) deamidase PncC